MKRSKVLLLLFFFFPVVLSSQHFSDGLDALKFDIFRIDLMLLKGVTEQVRRCLFNLKEQVLQGE